MTGHYLCAICHGYIRPEKGQKAVNYQPFVSSKKNGSYSTYYSKAHKSCLEKELELKNQ